MMLWEVDLAQPYIKLKDHKLVEIKNQNKVVKEIINLVIF